MSKVLTVEQREQAGSDSYNRFEYQVHWIVCHIIGKLQEDAECIKLRDFVQVINRTGSETPRLVYMYQSALYLYNLERAYSPFNFYVVDTPNQQGQDADNLQSIFESLELFLSNEGQVIVGTERETGIEKRASNAITLTEKRRYLTNAKYNEHIEFLQMVQKIAISWVAENHKKQNDPIIEE